VTRKDYEVKLRERIRMQHKSDGITAAKSPLESLLENPAIATELREQQRRDEEPPTLKLFAG
jgi:hypothetical protein